jgi:hypothetical protein
MHPAQKREKRANKNFSPWVQLAEAVSAKPMAKIRVRTTAMDTDKG